MAMVVIVIEAVLAMLVVCINKMRVADIFIKIVLVINTTNPAFADNDDNEEQQSLFIGPVVPHKFYSAA
jgi:hypothetical protein